MSLARAWPLNYIMVQEALRSAASTPELARVDGGSAPLDLPKLYTEYFDLVWRNLRRLGVPAALLDDAVQDVFLVVHRRGDAFLGRSSMKTWIIGIVLRVAHDYRRSQARHAARLAHYAAQGAVLAGEPDCPSEQAALREAAGLVQRLVAGFTEQERSVFVLTELEEMSLREVAEATGLSLATCQRRLAAARRAFNDALGKHDASAEREPVA